MGRPVVQWQILTKDPAKSEAFYTALFGWKVDADNPLGYRVVDTDSGRGIPGGFWPAPPEAPNSFVQLFVEVDDVAASVQQATALGASVLMPPQRLPQGEQMAILLDPVGVPFGLLVPTRVGKP